MTRSDHEDVASAASATSASTIEQAHASQRTSTLQRRMLLLRNAMLAGVVLLLACIALIVAACVSSSSRAAAPTAAYRTYLQYRAQFDCGGGGGIALAPSPSEKHCDDAARALVVAWREAHRSIPIVERAGAVLAEAVGIMGFAQPPSHEFLQELDVAVRTWPAARERAELPRLATLRDARVANDDDVHDARVQLENVHPRVLFASSDKASAAAFLRAALKDERLRATALTFALEGRVACTDELLRAARVSTSQQVQLALMEGLTCRRVLGEVAHEIEDAARLSAKLVAPPPSTTAEPAGVSTEHAAKRAAREEHARIMWRAFFGLDFARAVDTLAQDNVQWSLEPMRMLRQGAVRASPEERAQSAARADELLRSANGPNGERVRLQALAVYVALANIDAPGAAACAVLLDELLSDTYRASNVSRLLSFAGELGCSPPADLVERARIRPNDPRDVRAAIARLPFDPCTHPLVAMYGVALASVRVDDGNADEHAFILDAQRSIDVHLRCRETGLPPAVLDKASVPAGDSLDARTRHDLAKIITNQSWP